MKDKTYEGQVIKKYITKQNSVFVMRFVRHRKVNSIFKLPGTIMLKSLVYFPRVTRYFCD